ncbi:MAG: hypothetical protein M4579_001058 [Chaenotheca gracillima]|nr:MAG: hypothetical protein M4579_001058 [Chaenotheca gracillima]
MVASYVAPEYDTSNWAVLHPDLHSANLLVHKDWSIAGLLDWDLMSAQPLQKWAVFPKLIEHLPGAAPPDIPAESMYLDFAQDKAYFVKVLKEKEKKLLSAANIAKLVQSSTKRAFFEMSHNAPTVHKEFADRYCKRTKVNVEAATNELECFLAGNPSISPNDIGIKDVEIRLKELLAGFGNQ